MLTTTVKGSYKTSRVSALRGEDGGGDFARKGRRQLLREEQPEGGSAGTRQSTFGGKNGAVEVPCGNFSDETASKQGADG